LLGVWRYYAGWDSGAVAPVTVELAAKADGEGGVEEGGHQGETGGETERAEAGGDATTPTAANTNPTSCAN
jgi:hypothetical protein